MVIVFRVEDENGCGPYKNPRRFDIPKLDNFLSNHCKENGRPAPFQQGEPWEDYLNGDMPSSLREHIFGFLLLQDLHTWFRDCLHILLENGFKISAYPVNEDTILLGNSGQISFQKPPGHPSNLQSQIPLTSEHRTSAPVETSWEQE